MGKFVSDSGFEDIVFQANLCTSGSLRGVISGTHYNRAWIVHTGKQLKVIQIFAGANLPHCL